MRGAHVAPNSRIVSFGQKSVLQEIAGSGCSRRSTSSFLMVLEIYYHLCSVFANKRVELRWNFYASKPSVFVSGGIRGGGLCIGFMKRPFYFLVLQKALKDDFEFWFISFSRDPRGVANSL